jgi:hypothetical protein
MKPDREREIAEILFCGICIGMPQIAWEKGEVSRLDRYSIAAVDDG